MIQDLHYSDFSKELLEKKNITTAVITGVMYSPLGSALMFHICLHHLIESDCALLFTSPCVVCFDSCLFSTPFWSLIHFYFLP